ncbi:hypothetical protein C8F04DRAFT_1253497 [Mycena alexandri]|uniref:Uncharacterized protein n=1 Tax=Mycena alexandri TaxID=1745969 RepID=A0AAD6TBN1_9AGAR|nr:hypothetical protein C8F04DRAFT_1253497 [Mycena alexandri]
MEGGDLNWFWAPYALYQKVDLAASPWVYGIPSFERGDGFLNAQSLLNIVEALLNILYVYTAHVVQWLPPPLWASTPQPRRFLRPSSIGVLIQYQIIPGGLWIVFPSFILLTLWKDLAADLTLAHNASVKAVSGKRT